MDFRRWEIVVVEWVNCLKLCKSVSCVKDLKDGLFFFSLLKLLLPVDSNEVDGLTDIIEFLRKQYPKIVLDYLGNLLIQDLLEIDLLAIASLLLHYSCVFDRRDVLTSPLCHRLSKTTQVHIRAFLESVKNHITNDELFEIIDQCINKNTKSKSVQSFALQAGDSFLMCGSPLQDFLQTPPSKPGRWKERDQKISKLQHEIDLERFEKDDLKAELDIQKGRNQKLGQQMNDKTAEIVKLRGEISDLENKVLQHYEGDESRELQQRLRGEIESLEKYVAQLENEQELLQNERDVIRDSLKKVESQYMLWQNKSVLAEQSFDNLLEKYEHQELEILNLRSQCHELTSLLEELQSFKRINDSSIEMDTSIAENGFRTLESGASGENLACNVVEVQLKDAQKENSELKNILKDSQDSAKRLNDEVKVVKANFAGLQSNYDSLKADNEQLLIKVAVLADTQLALEDARQELEQSLQEINEISQQNVSSNATIAMLESEMDESRLALMIMEESNDALSKELILLKDNYSNIEENLAQKTANCTALENCVNVVQAEYDTLMNNYNKTNFNMESVSQKLMGLDTNMEQSLKKLERFVFGSNKIEMDDKGGAFEIVFTQLEANYLQQLNEKKVLTDNLADFEGLILKLRTDLDLLNEKEAINLQERRTLTDNLKCADQQIILLENAITDHLEKIQNLNYTVSEMTSTISDLEKLKADVEQKENVIGNLEAATCSLEVKLKKSADELTQSRALQEDLKKSLESLERIKGDFEIKITEAERKLTENKENEANQNQTIAELNALTSIFEQQILEKTEDLKQRKEIEENLQQKLLALESQKTSLELQLYEANEKIVCQNYTEKLLEKRVFDQQREYQENIKILNVEIEGYKSKINELEIELQNWKSNYAVAQKDLEIGCKSVHNLLEQMEFYKSDFDKRINILHVTLTKLEQNLQAVVKDRCRLEQTLDNKTKECEELKLKRDLDLHQYGTMEDELKKTVEVLMLKEAECVEKDDLLSKANQELLMIKLDVEQKNDDLSTMEMNIAEQEIKIQELEERIISMDIKNEDMRHTINELQVECSIIKNLKGALETKCDELESTSWRILSELSSKNEQFDALIQKYQLYQEKTEAELSSLQNSLSRTAYEYDELTKVKDTLVSENKEQIDDLQDRISQLNQVVDSLNNREELYLEEIRTMKDELSDTITKYTEALQVRQEIVADNEIHVNHLTENLHELIEKYNKLDRTNAESILELKNAQDHMDALENYKIELEGKLVEQKLKFESEYNSYTSRLNAEMNELLTRETELKINLLDITEKLKTSQENTASLDNDFKQACSELAQLKTEKVGLRKKLNELGSNYQEVKKLYDSLKLSHLQLVKENYENLSKLQAEILQQVGILMEENSSLKTTIDDLYENIRMLKTEQEIISTIHNEKLEQKDILAKTLKDDIKIHKDHIDNLVAEKKAINEQIGFEKEQLLIECQREFDETIQENLVKIDKHETDIIKLKCANDILETGKGNFQEEIRVITRKIRALKQTKLNDEQKYTKELENREEEIKNLKDKIDLLQAHVAGNITKNNELMLELCTVNESLECLTKQHDNLQQVLSGEKQELSEKLDASEAEATNKQVILDNLQSENNMLSQEMSLTKKEIENLKAKLKNDLLERQALELEIKTSNEKLLGQESVVRRQEGAISEVNAKLLGKLEEVLELEKEKRTLQEKLEELSLELSTVKQSRDDILESQPAVIKEYENNLVRAHESAVEVKNDLLQRIELEEKEKIHERQLRDDLQKLLDGEKVAKEILELRLLELTNEKFLLSQMYSTLKHSVQSLSFAIDEKPVEIVVDGEVKELCMSDLELLNSNIEMVKGKILEFMEQKNCCVKMLSTLENDKDEITQKIEQLTTENQMITEEKEQLIKDYNVLLNEKIERKQDLACINDIQLEHDILKAKYEQLMKYNESNENINSENKELQDKLVYLENKTAKAFNTYKKYAGYSAAHKFAIDKLINERNALESALNNVKQGLASIQMKLLHISDDREHAKLTEQMQSFEIIIEDIQKQFLRTSRKIHETILAVVQIPADIYDIVSSEKLAASEDVFDQLDFDEELEKVIDCKDRTTNLLEQMVAFESSLRLKTAKIQKENVLRTSNNTNTEVKVKDEELKKRNTLLKQRLTLSENAKSNLEKKIKQLREENKKLNSRSETADYDSSYKILLQQHIQTKEEYEKTVNDYRVQYDKLLQEHKEYVAKTRFIPDQIKYEKEMKTEHDVKLEREIVKLREAYGNVMSDNSKLDLENLTMRKLLDDRTSQLSELTIVKETYEKLLEENNKLRMELDTVTYKRNRDREALYDAINKDRNETKKIQEVRNEYETKLEKMKNKMIQLYREEIDKESSKHQTDNAEKEYLIRTVRQLKQNLKEVKMESVRSSGSQNCEFCSCRSYSALPDVNEPRDNTFRSSASQEIVPFKGAGDSGLDRNSVVSRRRPADERKYVTLPRSTGMSVIEENFAPKRNTLSSLPPELGKNFEMEDEDDDLFNNKYLADLKEGRCVLPSNRESNASRLSELKWRNSLCPPHLKSSYPGETQFTSPRQFKDDDLKSGILDFNESMSTRLIPGEKPRKKDIGTTSYKKPGPPTPSKNGGRVSLQGTEAREVLREQNETKTPKRTTPSRLKALFMGRNSSVRDNSENQPGTPRSKRLSIFRKPK